jgi:hypothetical protein
LADIRQFRCFSIGARFGSSFEINLVLAYQYILLVKPPEKVIG